MDKKVETLKVHPVADLFPMMTDGELADLAADIKTNGLNYPIILDVKGETLIDGRNRLKACELAGVKPRFERLNGQDPVAYVFSSNDRRDMTQGQRAIVAAECSKLEQWGDFTKVARALKVPKSRVSEAVVIVGHAPDLGQQVKLGELAFSRAYESACGVKAEAKNNAEKMARLKAEAPDLADLSGMSLDEAIAKLEQRKQDAAKLNLIVGHPDLIQLVNEGRMSVMDACAEHGRRVEEDRAAREGATTMLSKIVGLIDGFGAPERLMKNVDDDLWPADDLGKLKVARLEECAQKLHACAELWGKREKGE